MNQEDSQKLNALYVQLRSAQVTSIGAGRNTYKLHDAETARIRAQIEAIKSKYRKPEVKRETVPTGELAKSLEQIREHFAIRPKQPRRVLPQKQYVALKKYILERDKWCVFCGRTDMLTPAHIIRRSAGGHDAPNNIVCACVDCHKAFDDRTIELPENVIGMLYGESDTWEKM